MTGSAAPPDAMLALVEALRRLPGVGVKSAQRMAYHLLQHDRDGAQTGCSVKVWQRSQWRMPCTAWSSAPAPTAGSISC